MTSAGSPPEHGSSPQTDAVRPVTVASVVPLVRAWRLDRPFDYAVPETLRDKLQTGMLVRVPLGGRRVRGVVVNVARRRPERALQDVAAIVVSVPLAPPPLSELLDWVARRYAAILGQTFERVVPPRVRVRPPPAGPRGAGPLPALLRSYEGGPALVNALEGDEGGAFCLRPLPSHDRGDLITELVAAAGRAGTGTALVAVPEVHYGSRVIDKLAAVYPGLARAESAVSDGDRSRALLALAAGAPVGAGGRAVVLAPAPEVRLIVLDEEHHPSFKEDRSPRYDARRVAVERARLHGAVCVLVSATPSMETGAAVLRGRARAVVPDRSAARAARPIVEIVHRPDDRALSPSLHERIRESLRAGEPVALLVPRTGYARAIWCAACRNSVRCPVCEAGLFFDRARRQVRCSRCGYHDTAPDVCPTCGAHEFRFVGAGSERLAEQIGATFPRAVVERADPQMVGDRARRQRRADIYVTTWIGTKETLRPPASLVGVLDGDSLIRRPDFRAAEHAHQALVEMAGWAGPAGEGGRLVIQTTEPSHHSVQAVARADYRYFFERELEQRRELGYPPFAELVKVNASGPRARELIEKAAVSARGVGARVLGPMQTRYATHVYGARRRNTQREGLEILVKCDDAMKVGEALRGILASTPAGNRLRVDVDPR
jgi:primosomal protein N'